MTPHSPQRQAVCRSLDAVGFPAKFPPSDRFDARSGYDPADRLFKRPDGSLMPRINAWGVVLAALNARRGL